MAAFTQSHPQADVLQIHAVLRHETDSKQYLEIEGEGKLDLKCQLVLPCAGETA